MIDYKYKNIIIKKVKRAAIRKIYNIINNTSIKNSNLSEKIVRLK